MPRGSKRGERRGGRKRLTPNKRTVLAKRILALAEERPTDSARKIRADLINDSALPADIQFAVARRSMPAKFAPLLEIAKKMSAPPAVRRKAAGEIALLFLPKYAGRKSIVPRWRLRPDRCGFSMDIAVAREYRDGTLWLENPPKDQRNFAKKKSKLKERVEEIKHLLVPPCPSKYGYKELDKDRLRLKQLALRRKKEGALSVDYDTLEARATARIDSFMGGAEATARLRLYELQIKQEAIDCDTGDAFAPEEQVEFRFLSLLYPSLERPDARRGERFPDDHPFFTESLDEGGTLYPWSDEGIDTPPYVIGNPNLPGAIWLDENKQPVDFDLRRSDPWGGAKPATGQASSA